MKLLSRSEADTFNAGFMLGKKLAGGSIVLLSGFLGAGKTVFSKGIAAGLGVKDEVLSPTFTLMCEYETETVLTLCHIDAYRLKNAWEALEAGLGDVIGAVNTVSVVEWHENITELFTGKKVTHVKITALSETEREITIHDQ